MTMFLLGKYQDKFENTKVIIRCDKSNKDNTVAKRTNKDRQYSG